MIDHDALVRDTNELEPLPASVIRMLGLLSSDDWSVDAVVKTASLDPGLTARVLRVANSAASSSVTPVTTLKESTMRLGATTVVKLATGSAMRGYIAAPDVREESAGEADLWRKSVATALTADFVREVSTVEIPPEAFTVALLNDIGRIVLTRHLDGGTLSELAQAVTMGEQDPLEAEREILGVDHAELGALIAEHWDLPCIIADSIRFHHRPLDAMAVDVQVLCDVIGVSDAVARVVVGEDSVMRSFDSTNSCGRLGISEEAFEKLCESTGEQLESALADYD